MAHFSRVPCCVLPLLLGATLGLQPPARAGERPDPSFDRGGAERSRAVRPPTAHPPSELSSPRPRRGPVAVAGAGPNAPPVEDEAARTRPGGRHPPRPLPNDADVERRGWAEGARTFDDRARGEGWRNLYRAGIFAGQRAALDDPSLGRSDYEQGLRLGRLDPAARDYGGREGAIAAERAASSDAPKQVERQFRDLSWVAVPSPRPTDARFDGAFAPTKEPDLESLFHEYPIPRVTALPRRMGEAFVGSRWSPAGLYHCSSWEQVVDESWQDGGSAFASWASDPGRSGFWRSLESPLQRGVFESAFVSGFDDRLRAQYPTLIGEAWAPGFEDGWFYGAFLRSEWSFRQGYVAGFDAGTAFAADVAFERTYAAAYARGYHEAFRDWMASARPELLTARLRDADDDGIFRPGEGVEVEFALANYGGADGSIRLELAGAPLRSPTSIELRVAARRTVDSASPLTAVLSADTHAPSEQTLVLSLAGQTLDLPLRVSYPMEFTGAVAYESHPLEGKATVRFEIVNRSRRPQERVALVRDEDAPPVSAERQPIGPVEPGAVAEAAFELDGVRPLDLLGGTLVVRAAVTSGTEVHDHKTARFPDLATQLDRPDLVAYLVRLGQSPGARLEDILGARRLLIQRLEADWNVRSEEKGNAYESDLRDDGVRTAVGELVRAYRGETPQVRDSLAFHGLDDEVSALADRLEGVHPNLRRSMRKLARRLAS